MHHKVGAHKVSQVTSLLQVIHRLFKSNYIYFDKNRP